MKKYILSGIGTDVGKTVVSAIVAEALKAYYWKPAQAGDLHYSDSMKVAAWTEHVTVLPEKFRLNTPASPHHAAELDQVVIEETDFELPQVDGNLLIEGAGGLMVPLNSDGLLYIDIFKRWDLPVILVSRHYLGSINHTLLSVEALKSRKIEIAGIIFVGEENPATESIIQRVTGCKVLGRIPIAEEVNAAFIKEQAKQFTFL